MTIREQPWSDDSVRGRVVVLTRNPIAEAIEMIAALTGREVVVVEEDDGRPRRRGDHRALAGRG